MKNLCLLVAMFLFYLPSFSQGLWVQKSTGPVTREASVSFEINGMGYVYNGMDSNNFFMYDPTTNSWTKKANFPGVGRTGASGFAIDTFGYVGTGKLSTTVSLKDFYKYNAVTNTWTALSNYPDSIKGALGFSINGKGFFAGGEINRSTITKKAMSYDPATDTWSLIDSLPSRMAEGFSAVAGNKAYCGFGYGTSFQAHNDSLFQYDPLLNQWTIKAPFEVIDFTQGDRIYSFVSNNKIYVCNPLDVAGGRNGSMGVYDIATNTWSPIKIYNYPSYKTCSYIKPLYGLTINGKGYIGGTENCRGMSFYMFDPANYFTLNSISPDTICENDSVTISISSSLTFNTGNEFRLVLGGKQQSSSFTQGYTDGVAGTTTGTYKFKVPNFIGYGSNISAEVMVWSSNPAHFTAYSDETILIKRAPRPTLMDEFVNACSGSAIILYRNAGIDISHSWSSVPAGISASGYTISFTPTQNALLYVTDLYNTSGCKVKDSINIIFNNSPAINISDSAFTICPGGAAVIGGTPVSTNTYLWTGSGFSSTLPNPTVSPTTNSVYKVEVTDTATKCKSKGNTTVDITVPLQQSICFVTVDSASTHNVVIWEKADKYAVDSFVIYREITTNNYQRIAAVHRDSLSEYHDYAANPNVTAYRYKISANDTCLTAGLFSTYHNTVHLQYLGSGNLNWNVYEIENSTTPVNSFDVLIDDSANGNWDLMLTVPGFQSSATDINYALHTGAKYKVVANFAYSCTPSRSGQSQIASNTITQNIGTGIAAINLDKMVRIYPNPAKDILTIDAGTLHINQVSILNVDGKVISQQWTMKNNAVDISLLAPGFYIVNVQTTEGTVRKQVVKL